MRKDRWERLRKQFCLKNEIKGILMTKMTYFKKDLVAGKKYCKFRYSKIKDLSKMDRDLIFYNFN